RGVVEVDPAARGRGGGLLVGVVGVVPCCGWWPPVLGRSVTGTGDGGLLEPVAGHRWGVPELFVQVADGAGGPGGGGVAVDGAVEGLPVSEAGVLNELVDGPAEGGEGLEAAPGAEGGDDSTGGELVDGGHGHGEDLGDGFGAG